MLEESLVLEGESTSDLARSRVFGFETGDLGRLDLLEDEDEDEAFRSAGCPGALRFMLSDGWPCKEVLLPKELLNKQEWVACTSGVERVLERGKLGYGDFSFS